ncbi:four helix bundle protein [Paraglaciecola sp. 25GB23A]|uniref:four helix bundle protein n=1 Tax=Paraglaciecola sp. 25GB23A TaxID=3156068 RepID=UPI0032AFC14A
MKYEDLDVWKRSYRLAVEIYKEFESCRDFSFKAQITRSALSVPSNIAVGWERYTEQEKHRFLSIAKGSIGELKTQTLIAIEIDYLTTDVGKMIATEAEEISKMLGALMKNLHIKR